MAYYIHKISISRINSCRDCSSINRKARNSPIRDGGASILRFVSVYKIGVSGEVRHLPSILPELYYASCQPLKSEIYKIILPDCRPTSRNCSVCSMLQQFQVCWTTVREGVLIGQFPSASFRFWDDLPSNACMYVLLSYNMDVLDLKAPRIDHRIETDLLDSIFPCWNSRHVNVICMKFSITYSREML
jgi:hypothetical protein